MTGKEALRDRALGSKAVSPDLYRGPYKYGDADAGKKYAADVQRIIEEIKSEQTPAVFICETLLGVGGKFPCHLVI